MDAKRKKKNSTLGLSFPNERLLEEAKARAGRLGMSLSAYACKLLEEDLTKPREISLRDEPVAYRVKTHSPQDP